MSRDRVIPGAVCLEVAGSRGRGAGESGARSPRPKTTPIATPQDVRERVIELRRRPAANGRDAGRVMIRWHLEQEGIRAPAPATIRRILPQTARGAAEFSSPQAIYFCADVERASAFYQRLGFQETFRTPETGPPIHVDLVLDGYRIGFASIASAREHHGLRPVEQGQRATITLWTSDAPHAYKQLTGEGVRGLAGPQVWLDRLLIAWIEDPDGHPIQLVQELEKRDDS